MQLAPQLHRGALHLLGGRRVSGETGGLWISLAAVPPEPPKRWLSRSVTSQACGGSAASYLCRSGQAAAAGLEPPWRWRV
eukprot:scaffold124988_cov42-Phaeocystis_antarctica.AAC.1